MQFPNAHSGVKKIFTAEILSLIGVVLFIAAAIAAFGVASIAEASNVETDVGGMRAREDGRRMAVNEQTGGMKYCLKDGKHDQFFE